jgi:hypothetical protein
MSFQSSAILGPPIIGGHNFAINAIHHDPAGGSSIKPD